MIYRLYKFVLFRRFFYAKMLRLHGFYRKSKKEGTESRMNHPGYREEHIYLEKEDQISPDAMQSVKDAIAKNNAVGTLVGHYDEQLTILSVSDYLLHTLNYSYREFQTFAQGSLKRLFCEDNQNWLETERFRRIHGEGEGRMLTGDGSSMAVHLYKNDSLDSQGEPIWILSVRADWEHENYRLMNEAIGSGPWYMDCDQDSQIVRVHWSAAFRRMLGFHDTLDFPNELASWADLLHPDEHDQILERLQAAISDKTNTIKYNVEYRLRSKDGIYRWYRAIAEITRRQDGSARRIAGVFLNIDKEKEATAMEHLIRSMIRVVDYFAICDLENNRYEYHTINLDQNYPAKGLYTDLITRVSEKFRVLDERTTLKECLLTENLRKHLRYETDVFKFEYCSNCEDIFRMASFVPVEWRGHVLTKVLWISMDITSAKKMEIESRNALRDAFQAAERANKAKTQFLSNMSHDIRTPMNAIVGLTALAGANIENQERVLSCLGKITKSSRHLLGLINEVLDMARIESGKISLTDEAFNLSELVENLINMVKTEVEDHEHTFEVNVHHLEHEAVYGDSLRIQQIFTNLMSNAIKYTPNGGHITFSIEEKPNGFSELGCFVFSIEDNGIGMTTEFQDKMFQPFSRADDRRTTNIQGTGLGMAITRNIIQMMNGDIQVESVLNKGTRVTVTIYLKLQNKKLDKIPELIDLPVLVVDDDLTACESTVMTLKEIGIAGEWVTSGQSAIERTYARHQQKEDFYAILMDWQMPGMDGIETTRRIREFVGSEVTIIVLTAYDYTEIEEEARNAGVDAFIEKPLFPSKLAAALRQSVSGKKELEDVENLSDFVEADYSGKRILLVEDNDLNREITTEIIGMSNVAMESASNGKEAVDKIASLPEDWYDLVLMDIQMPIMNGYEATAAIRSLSGKRGQVPIIAMTANAFAEDVQMAKNTGMNGHIPKPLEFSTLNKVLKKWLS